MYEYKAKITRVIDGDTFDFSVDLGFSITIHERIRLAHVNTPEIRGKEKILGLRVKEYVKKLIEGKEFIIYVYKKGKYGRYVADIELDNYDGDKWMLSDDLLEKDMAKEVDY